MRSQIRKMALRKFAIMDGSGYVATIGHYSNCYGLLYSNDSYMDRCFR